MARESLTCDPLVEFLRLVLMMLDVPLPYPHALRPSGYDLYDREPSNMCGGQPGIRMDL